MPGGSQGALRLCPLPQGKRLHNGKILEKLEKVPEKYQRNTKRPP